ncbi:MAG: hypothetical protein JW797_18100 [Bradymonadales bacterium]|nr:hypothetical protein [Bradymonadales bacterium]
MRNRLIIALGLLAILVVVLGACKQKNFSNMDYLAERIRVGDSRALREVARLTSPEDKVAMIPALVDCYNAGLNQVEVVSRLLDIQHPSAEPVFVDALRSDNTRMAGLAARGLGAIGALERVGVIAERLAQIRDPAQYEPFFEALRRLPGRPEVSGVVSDILMRPAGRIGGINTVKFGCQILGESRATDPATVEALIFGLVNFIPMPPQDALYECSLGLIQVGEPAVPALVNTFRAENATVNAHLLQMGYTVEVGSLRAAKVLAAMATPSALDAVVQWFSTEHRINMAELNAMTTEQAMNWFSNFGQQFMFATEYLGNLGRPGAEDPARAILIGLSARGQGRVLENFRDFMGTSDDAEIGLRAAAIQALTNVGDIADRDVMLEMAVAGTLGRAPNALIRKEAAHAFALLSQQGDLQRYQELLNATDDATLREELEVYRPMVDVAEECNHDLNCLSSYLTHESMWVREKAAFDLAHFTENRVGAAEALLSRMDHESVDTRYNYLRALRRLPLPPNGSERIDSLIERFSSADNTDLRYELRVLQVVKARG